MPAALHDRVIAFVCLLIAGIFAGCSRTPAPAPAQVSVADHDHADHGHGDPGHDHPTTLAGGIAALAKAAASVKDHLAGDAADEADEAVHDLGHLLEDLQGLVREESLSADAKVAATQAIDELFACFDELDTALHAEPGKGNPPRDVHASVAGRIEEAITSLRAAAASGTSRTHTKED